MKIAIYTAALLLTASVAAPAYSAEYSDAVAWRFNDLGVVRGHTVTMPVVVDNVPALSGWQCDITVPEGVTVTGVTLNPDRAADHTGTLRVYADNVYRYVAASMTFSGTTGTTGPLMYVKMEVNIPKEEDGVSNVYDITLSNLRSTDTDREHTSEYVSQPFTGHLTVIDQEQGMTYDVVEGQPYTNNVDYYDINVTYTRKFGKTFWQPLYVPFDMSYDEWSPYVDVAQLYNVRGFDTDNDGEIDDIYIEYSRLNSGSILPNTPYVIKAKAPGTFTFNCSNKTLKAAPEQEGHVECSSTSYVYAFYGIYETKYDLTIPGLYYMSNGDFYVTTNTSYTLAPYRTYMMITPKDGGYLSGAQSSRLPAKIKISVDGEVVDHIDGILTDSDADAPCYDLMGRKVNNPTHGIYISNGKKLLIK